LFCRRQVCNTQCQLNLLTQAQLATVQLTADSGQIIATRGNGKTSPTPAQFAGALPASSKQLLRP